MGLKLVPRLIEPQNMNEHSKPKHIPAQVLNLALAFAVWLDLVTGDGRRPRAEIHVRASI